MPIDLANLVVEAKRLLDNPIEVASFCPLLKPTVAGRA